MMMIVMMMVGEKLARHSSHLEQIAIKNILVLAENLGLRIEAGLSSPAGLLGVSETPRCAPFVSRLTPCLTPTSTASQFSSPSTARKILQVKSGRALNCNDWPSLLEVLVVEVKAPLLVRE